MGRKGPQNYDLPPMTKEEAVACGSKTYFTGNPCQHGHIAPRTVGRGKCVVCVRDYHAKWHRDRAAELGDAHRAKARMRLARDPARRMFNEVKGRATARGIPFSLKREDIHVPENCPCCDRKMTPRTGQFKKGWVSESPSLDRFDPTKGYDPSNVIVICARCNILKNNATIEELETVVRWMKSHQNKHLRLVS